jgi:hypothetical protein
LLDLLKNLGVLVKEARKEGKWAIIRNRKSIVRDRDQKDNNK